MVNSKSVEVSENQMVEGDSKTSLKKDLYLTVTDSCLWKAEE